MIAQLYPQKIIYSISQDYEFVAKIYEDRVENKGLANI